MRIIAACALALTLAACAQKSPTDAVDAALQAAQTVPQTSEAAAPTADQLAQAQKARKPVSELAAHKAIVVYFAQTLKDPDSAKYTYRPLISGVAFLHSSDKSLSHSDAGWFMCGTVNSKNSYGGYTGQLPFFAYFEPTSGSSVQEGDIDNPGWGDVDDSLGWCKQLYGN